MEIANLGRRNVSNYANVVVVSPLSVLKEDRRGRSFCDRENVECSLRLRKSVGYSCCENVEDCAEFSLRERVNYHSCVSESPNCDKMATANESDRDINSSRDRRDDDSENEDEVEVLEQSPVVVFDESDEPDVQLQGTPEELIDSLKDRFKFLAPKFFTLAKITKSTSAKKRAEIGLQFVCRNCPNTTVSAGVSSTSNLRRHIKSAHSSSLLTKFEEAWEEQKKKQKEKNLKRKPGASKEDDDNDAKKLKLQLQQPKLFRHPTQEQIDQNVIRFVIKTNQAYSVVEADSFKHLVLCGHSDKKVMSRPTLKKKIKEKFERMVGNLREEFEKANCLCITADIWSCATRSFLGVTAHWLKESDLSRNSAAIGCKRMEGRHTYDVIAKGLVKIMEDFNIQKKTTDAVTDSGSNFCKSFRVYAGVLEPDEDGSDDEDSDEDSDESENENDDLQPTELFPILEHEGSDIRLPPHTRCAAHKMNNIAGKDVDEALLNPAYKMHSTSAMKKARDLFKKQKKSTQAADHIRANCKGRLFIIPNKTRWNSTYDAIRRLNKNIKDSPDNLDGLMDLLGIRRFTEDDIKFLKEYCQVYSHFANVLDILQGQKNCHAGALLPLICGLTHKLEEESRKVEICPPLAQALIAGISTRFWGELSNDRLWIASAVHPRFKTLWIRDEEKRARVWELVRGELRRLQEPTETGNGGNESAEPQSTTEETVVDEMDLLVPMGSEPMAEDVSLLAVYMSQPTSKKLSSLDSFPLIKKLFIKTNTLLPSSAPAERLFSVGGNVFGKRRHSLTDESFEIKVLLKTNSDYWR